MIDYNNTSDPCPTSVILGNKSKVGRTRKIESSDIADIINKISDPELHLKENQLEQRFRNFPTKSKWCDMTGFPQIGTDIIPTQRLPTNRVIMQRYATLPATYNSKMSMIQVADILYKEILPIWQRTNILAVGKRNFCEENIWCFKYLS